MFTNTLNEIISSADIKTRIRIGRQFIPSRKEHTLKYGFTDDPMEEQRISSGHADRFVHKYPDKILIISSEQCPVLCRFCTRKRITFCDTFELAMASSSIKTIKNNLRIKTNFDLAVSYILKHKRIKEAIFSGGDPFMLTNKKIHELLGIFLKIPQLLKIRFHSRAVTMLPERFNDALFLIFREALNAHPEKQIRLVMHVNHPAELTHSSLVIVRKFLNTGIPVLSQTVLLRHVNDNAAILKDLFTKLVGEGIKPYYLHQLDKVTGSAHFEVNINHGIEIIKYLRKELPLCAIPSYVTDGLKGKKEII